MLIYMLSVNLIKLSQVNRIGDESCVACCRIKEIVGSDLKA